MTTYEERLATFTSLPTPWPYNWFEPRPMPQPKTLAAAGFSFLPTGSSPDQVECSKCSLRLHDWRSDTKIKYNAFMEHECPAPDQQAALQRKKAQNPGSKATYEERLTTFHSSDPSLQNDFSELRLNPNDDSSTKLVKESDFRETGTINMESYKKRLATFTSWPHVSPSATDLARAGFVYAPSEHCPDKVRCLECNQHITNWQPREIPLIEHVRIAPHCKLANEIADANKQGTPPAPRSLTEKGSQLVAQPKLGLKPQVTTEAESVAQKAWRLKYQQSSSKQHEQQAKGQLQQPKPSKQDQQNKAEFLQTTAQDSKKGQIDESISTSTQIKSVVAATISAPLKQNLTAITPTVVPAVSAAATVAETSTSNRPIAPPTASSTPPDHHISDQSCDTKAEEALAKTKVSVAGGSLERVALDVGDWVEVDLAGEEKDDWVQV